MERLLIVLALVGVAAVVALVVQRRRTAVPATPPQVGAPDRIDRAGLEAALEAGDPGDPGDDIHASGDADAGAAWLLVVFGSTSCYGCGQMVDRSLALRSTGLGAVSVTSQDFPDLHRRYGITAVPTTVLADGEGVVHRWWVGQVPADRFQAEVMATVEGP